MNLRVSGALATVAVLALTSAASAQSTNYYQQIQSGYQQGIVAPAATSTYRATPSAPIATATSLPSAYAAAPTTTYTQPTASVYAPQQTATTYAPARSAAPVQQPTYSYLNGTLPSYGSSYLPPSQTAYAPSVPPTYVTPQYGSASGGYQVQQLPAYQQPAYQQPTYGTPAGPQTLPVPATAYTPAVPAAATPKVDTGLPDTDTWSFNFARFYPAVQACLRKSAAKNPVIANIQVSDNKTKMLIGEGGSSSYSICTTGLSGTTVKANSDIRTLPPAFFAPLGSTFTVSPDRPFQPIVDTDQKVIGWLVRTQPSNSVNQFGQAASFDGQFIPPMMVNTGIGKS